MNNVGTRAQVMRGTALKTSYGKNALFKKDLKYNKNGKIVSKKKSSQAKKDNRLVKAGYITQKGKFGFIKVSPKQSTKKSKKRSTKRGSKKRGSKKR